MKAITLAALALAVIGSVSAQAENKGIQMMLLNAVDTTHYSTHAVMLRATSNEQCHFVGELVQLRKSESFFEKMVAQEGGMDGQWAISIKREMCGDAIRTVSLQVPLEIASLPDDYLAGAKVVAYPL